MPLIAVLLDLLVAGGWWVQAQQMNHSMFIVGMIFQVIVTVVLLVMMFVYQGRRRRRFRVVDGGYRPLTFRFGIIALSFVVNAILVILYYFNLAGINQIIFTGTPK